MPLPTWPTQSTGLFRGKMRTPQEVGYVLESLEANARTFSRGLQR